MSVSCLMVLILCHQQCDQDNRQHMFRRLLSEVLHQQSQRHRQLPIRGLDYFSEFYNGFIMWSKVGCVFPMVALPITLCAHRNSHMCGIRTTGRRTPHYDINYKTHCLSNDSSDSLDSCFALIAVLNMAFIILKSSIVYNLKSKKAILLSYKK